jgi:uncharacterized surface protein with fasciclin (FAS1) repeats
VETAQGSPELFSTLVGFIVNAGLVEILSGKGPFTVFAPTNDAFAALSEETVASLTANTTLLAQVLTYHVMPGKILAADLKENMETKTVEGSTVKVESLDPYMINDATVITADIMATNGVIHVIDTVLIPTIDLDSDDATDPKATMDVPTTMDPPVSVEPNTEASPLTGSIVDLAAATEDLSTLAGLLGQAGFLDVLNGPGPFTVFAPTNAAFASLYGPIRNYIVRTPSLLNAVLAYHVINGTAAFSTDMELNMMAMTLEGCPVTVTSLSPVMINRAVVTTADIEASNGVIHIIDAIMLPPP